MFGLGIRDMVLLVGILGSLPVCVFRPFFGLLVFSWLAYMRPTDMAWGAVDALHPSLLVAAATVVGVLLSREERVALVEKRTVLIGLFVTAVVVSALLAIEPGLAWGAPGETTQLLKVAFVAVLTTGLVRSYARLRILLLVIGGSLGLLALKTLVQGFFHPGLVHHGPGGMILDNNDYGLALVMTLPLVGYMARDEKGLLLKLVLGSMAVACVGGVLLTRSRGGFVALAVIGALWLLMSRKNAWALIAAPLAVVAVVVVTPAELLQRLRILTGGALDESAQHRLVAWQKSFGMASANPVLGVGPGGFMSQWSAYPPATEFAPVVTHNTYLQLLAESGWVALTLYVALMVVTLFSLQRLRRDATETWRRRYASALLLSLTGFMAGSLFLSRALYDLPYHLIGISVGLAVASSEREFDWFGLRPLEWVSAEERIRAG